MTQKPSCGKFEKQTHTQQEELLKLKISSSLRHSNQDCLDAIREKADTKFEKTIEKYHSILDYSALGIMLLNDKGILTVCNEKLAEILSTKAERLTGFDLIKSVKNEKVRDAAKRVLSGQITHYEGEYTSIISGKSSYLRGVFLPIFSDDGSLASVICVVEDLTHQKETEEALQKAHDELEKRVAERTKDLDQKTKRLVETNIALEILLERREADKKKLAVNVLQNVEKLILPYLKKLQLPQNDISRDVILDIIQANLYEITSSFIVGEKDCLAVLTPTQLRIADLIKHGHTTKEIAHLLNLSPSTISGHRHEIRKRLSLTNKKINLQSALITNSR